MLSPEHLKYILENIETQPIEEIARTLKIRKKTIRKFLKKRESQENSEDDEVSVPAAKPKLKNIWLSAAIIVVLGFTVYGNSISGQFIWDDDYLISKNEYIKDWNHIPEIFSDDIGTGSGKKFYSYRPLQILSYRIDYLLWGVDPRGYHIVSISLHILTSLTVLWLIFLLSGNGKLSLLTSVLFLVHPVHTEAVAYISGRADSLSLFLILVSMVVYIKQVDAPKVGKTILMLSAYTLSLLARENSIIFPMLLLLYHYTFQKRVSPKSFTPVIVVSVLYLFMRLVVLKHLMPHTIYPTTALERLPGFFVAIASYIRLLFLPFNLHMEYVNRIFPWFTLEEGIGIIILLSCVICAIIMRRNHPLIFFGIVWFFLTLLPVANIYPITTYMAEHWLYLPSIGFFLLLSMGLFYLWRFIEKTNWRRLLIASVLVFFGGITIMQNHYWQTPLIFYERTLEFVKDSPRMCNNLGVLYADMGRREEAIALFKHAIFLFPTDETSYRNLGQMYIEMGEHQQAAELYKKLIAVKQNDM